MCTTTLNKIRANHPCLNGWHKLLTHLGKTSADNEPVTLNIILESNGLDDARWCLRASDATEFEMRRFARLAALDVAHMWDMPVIVREYLETGDETKRAAAEAAAGAAARGSLAAWAAARAALAAWAAEAAWGAAQYAAMYAAERAAVKIQTERFISMFCTESEP